MSNKAGSVSRCCQSIILLIILMSGIVLSSFASPQRSIAQTVTITTSADSHGATFFGEGLLQVIVTDLDKDDEDIQEDIAVEIDANPAGSFASASGTFIVPETNETSSKFEFYLAHDLADDILPSDLDTENVNGAAEYNTLSSGPGTAEAPVIRFGVSQELPVTTGLFDDVTFTITVGDEEVVVDYEQSAASLELDRSTYGSDSIVHVFMIDQDANKNPTQSDSFTLSLPDLQQVVFEIDGGSFEDAVTFSETGDNTARFEATLQLASAASSADNELSFNQESVQVTLNDKGNYDDPGGFENDSTDTSTVSFDIDDTDGELDEITNLTFSSELSLTLRDNDQNKDSEDDETLDDAVAVSVDSLGGDVESLDMVESDDNTAVFLIDLSDDELPVTFLADGLSPTVNNSKLELRQGDITEDIIIEYSDPLDDDSLASITSSMVVEMTLATGILDIPDNAGVNDKFLMTLTDGDLNDNPRVKDSYTFALNQVGPYDLSRGGNTIGELANLGFELEGNQMDFGAASIAYTIVENDVNSGVFTAQLDMGDLLSFGNDGGPVAVDDGDVLKITYNDFMGDVAAESSDELAIGESAPPEGGVTCMGLAATIIGTDGDDVLDGTEGADVIVGLRGNDTINGLGGDDIICGGLGLDQLRGGDGNDKLLGGNANDVISGEGGDDMIWGGTGWDRLIGGVGDDILRGGIGNDHLAGGDGNDRLFGQEGFDHLDGGAGDNLLVQD